MTKIKLFGFILEVESLLKGCRVLPVELGCFDVAQAVWVGAG